MIASESLDKLAVRIHLCTSWCRFPTDDELERHVWKCIFRALNDHDLSDAKNMEDILDMSNELHA